MSQKLLLFLLLVVSFFIHGNLFSMEPPAEQAKKTFYKLKISPAMKVEDRKLLEAVAVGDKEKVLEALQNHADINTTDLEGVTALHYAAGRNDEVLVNLLLGRGASIEATTIYGATPLHIAANAGREAAVRLLLEKGADIEATSINGTTPLHMAAANGHHTVVNLLLARGARINAREREGRTSLLLAASQGHHNVVRALLSQAQTDINAQNSRNVTPLAAAIAANHIGAALVLITYGAEATPEQINRVVTNPLFRAAALGDLKELENNLKTDTPQNILVRALFLAAGRGHLELVNRLLATGVDPRSVLITVKTILQRPFLNAVTRAQYQAIRQALIKRLPLKDQIIESPELHAELIGRRFYQIPEERREQIYTSKEEKLIRAILAGLIRDIIAALEAGANPNARDPQGNTPLWLAALTQSNPEFIQTLLRHGADPNIPNMQGQTLIEWAAHNNNGPLVRQLLLFGARASELLIRKYLSSRLAPEAALGNTDTVLRLLSDPIITRQEVEEALLYAATQGHETLVRILVTALGLIPQNIHEAVGIILRRRGLPAYEAVRYQEIARIIAAPQDIPVAVEPIRIRGEDIIRLYQPLLNP
jgi:ankyrin repeat protein